MKIFFVIALLLPPGLLAQDKPQDKQQAKFYRMVDALLDHSVDEVRVADEIPKNAILLDARSIEEFKTSHIKNARFVGYDNFDMTKVENLDKDAEVLVYCSVGYRSEKVAEKLTAAGFTNVSNLYGGLFDWTNQGLEVVDSLGQTTDRVHGFNKSWGKWLTNSKVVY